MYIDTHCHLSTEDYDDIDLIIKENRKAEVSKIIVSGCTKSSIKESLDIANKYDDVYLTIGYHPSEVKLIEDYDLDLLEEQLSNKKIVGVGEIGLDYHYGTDDKEEQKTLFIKQLAIAEKYNLPVVIHSRDAVKDTIDILKKFPNVRGVIHCFSGSYETAKEYISMGYLLGIGGVVTFKNSKLQSVIKNIDIDNILFETDSPYLTPEPFRGQKNSSKYLYLICKKISEIYEVEEEIIQDKVINNTYRMFDLK